MYNDISYYENMYIFIVYFRSLQFTRLVSLLRSLQLAWSVLCAPGWRRSSYSPPTSSQSYSPTLYRARVRCYLPICRIQTMCYSPLTQLSRGGEMCCSLMDLQLQLREGINHYFFYRNGKILVYLWTYTIIFVGSAIFCSRLPNNTWIHLKIEMWRSDVSYLPLSIAVLYIVTELLNWQYFIIR